MIRAGSVLLALAVALLWLSPYAPAPFRIASLLCLVAGAACAVAGREPWPACCPHCHEHELYEVDEVVVEGLVAGEPVVDEIPAGRLAAALDVTPAPLFDPDLADDGRP